VVFVFAGNLRILEWLLSFCSFSLFSHFSCCFTRLKKKLDTPKMSTLSL
jgi:hypothetical protein